MVNLVMPSTQVNSLMVDLKKGDFLGYKFSYFYSGKLMLSMDAFVLVISVVLSDLFKDLEFLLTDYISGLFILLSTYMTYRIIKDLKQWIPRVRRFVEIFWESHNRL